MFSNRCCYDLERHRTKKLQQLKPAFVQNYVVAGGGSAVVTTAPGVVEVNCAAISA